MTKQTRAEHARNVKAATRYDLTILLSEIENALTHLDGIAPAHPPELKEAEDCLQRALTIVKRLDLLSRSSSG